MFWSPSGRVWKGSTYAGGRFTALLDMALPVTDLVCLLGAGVFAYRLRFGEFAMGGEYARTLGLSLLFGLIAFHASSLYQSWRGRALAAEMARVTMVWSAMFIAMIVYGAALSTLDALSRVWWLTWFLLSLASACSLRIGARRMADWLRVRGVDRRTAVIVGGGRDAESIAKTFAKEQWVGIDVLGWFDSPDGHHYLNDAPQLGSVETLAAYVEQHQVHQIWIALPMSAQAEIARVLALLRHSTADIKFVPDFFGIRLLNHSVEQIAGLPVINLQQTPLHGGARVVKAIEDRLLALLILLVIAPVMVAIAIAVKLSSPGPVFYRQERVSWNGRTFKMLKFRSMPVDAETATGPVWARSGENRATRVGAFLRRTSLDELPQFLNVLKGDMSIVGPRPERPVFVEKFRDEIPAYMQKHMVKGGITGWAQVNGWRGSTDLKRRIEYDIFYIQNWSLLLDLRIIVQTVLTGFAGRNAY